MSGSGSGSNGFDCNVTTTAQSAEPPLLTLTASIQQGVSATQSYSISSGCWIIIRKDVLTLHSPVSGVSDVGSVYISQAEG